MRNVAGFEGFAAGVRQPTDHVPGHAAQVYTDKKENQIFLIYREIQSGTVAKSFMRKGFLIYEDMRKYFPYMVCR